MQKLRGRRTGVFGEPRGPTSAWDPELAEEGRTPPYTGPWCPVGSWGQGQGVPSEPTHEDGVEGNDVYVPKTPLSPAEPGYERAAVEGSDISWDFVSGPGLNGHSQEPGKMMWSPAGLQSRQG